MALELMDELAARDILGGCFSTAPSMYPETHFLSFITLHLAAPHLMKWRNPCCGAEENWQE